MASVVNMCNSALNLLGASTIISLTDDTKMQGYAIKDMNLLEIECLDLIIGIV